jgi:hypothetical protein
MKNMKKILLFTFTVFILTIGCKIEKGTHLETKVIDTLRIESKFGIEEDSNHQLKIIKFNDTSLNEIYFSNNSKSSSFKDILPILTLLLGIVINKMLDRISECKKIKRNGERWGAEIRSLTTPIEKQCESLEKLIIEINKDEFKIPTMTINPALNCEIFNSFDKVDLIRYFEKFRNVNFEGAVAISNNIHSTNTILAGLYIAMKEKYNDYLEAVSEHTTSLSRNLQELMASFGNYGVDLEIEIGQDPINDARYSNIYSLFSKFIIPKLGRGDFDIYALEKDFYIPLSDELSKLRTDRRTKEMVDNVFKCFNDIKGIKMERGYIAENIKTIIERYKELSPDIKEIIRKFDT